MSASRHINAGQSDRSQMYTSFSAKFAVILEGALRNRNASCAQYAEIAGCILRAKHVMPATFDQIRRIGVKVRPAFILCFSHTSQVTQTELLSVCVSFQDFQPLRVPAQKE